MKNSRLQFVAAIAYFFLFLVNLSLVVLAFWLGQLWLLWVVAALLAIAFVAHDLTQKKHTLLRNFPVVGRMRYLLETLRPPVVQYFMESDLNGKPFNRRQRSIVYQRAKNVRQTVAFGMQADPYTPGYEWLSHSMYPVKIKDTDLRVTVGTSKCTQPYDLSVLNVGAMSYGALSKTAVASLSEGAKLGGFAQNTGEGGISSHHLNGGGDLIWQIGTGYFGCRNEDGTFNAELFQANAMRPNVKMIELKLSQGAKPGHGGILPAVKNTPEIAAIRNVKPGVTVYSPGHHSAFSDANSLLIFIDELRTLSGGKPVGFKLCVGNPREFEEICQAMDTLKIYPDFIAVDGGEGGTGAAPLEFTDYLGMPLLDALAFVSATVKKYNVPSKIIASGKIITAFDILKALALGADACYSARGMMMALGCIQALTCDSGHCPVGITTQNKRLYRGIDVTDKRVRVASFHKNTLHAVVELMEACGYKSLSDVKPEDFHRRINISESQTLEQVYFNNKQNTPQNVNAELLTHLN
ncbi:MAG TPA: FMN-binding glutamate synthase family protein [Daejeonella sp.]|nr:FMN-binding glutamate synthase family protein [Daejeonella sp.]